jgi:hypothetical protein
MGYTWMTYHHLDSIVTRPANRLSEPIVRSLHVRISIDWTDRPITNGNSHEVETMSCYLGKILRDDLARSQQRIRALLGLNSCVGGSKKLAGKRTQEDQCFCRRLSISSLPRVSPSSMSVYWPPVSSIIRLLTHPWYIHLRRCPE